MSNKTVPITGASSGIGKETAKSLVDEGYRICTAAGKMARSMLFARKWFSDRAFDRQVGSMIR